ncbi:MAG: hypothetical protein ACI8XO_000800 [Verrucomicrobiales bacterium]|jgi:hypothetical protein
MMNSDSKFYLRLAAIVSTVLIAAAALITPIVAQNNQTDRSEMWKKVDQAVKKGLPKTAIEEVEPIIASAIADKAFPEAIKAVAKKITLEGLIEGNKAEEKITRLQAEIATAAKSAPEMVPVMEAILANWYWSYFQQNRWRYMQRTQTGGSGGDDILTWDLARILGEIDQQFQKALSHSDVLKKTPVSEYDIFLTRGNAPDSFRPTMFDFVVHDALLFYAAGEQAGSRSIDAFDLAASSPIFSPQKEFLAWKIAPEEDRSPTVRALRLLQDVAAFHQGDEPIDALIDADLERLRFGFNQAFGEEKNARYKAALKRFIDSNIDHRISARAIHQLASVIQSEGDLVEALKLARRGVAVHPETPGGKRCANLVASILQPDSSVITERVWNQPLPTIDVTYKNVTKIYFRAVPFDWEERLGGNRYRPEQLDQNDRNRLLELKPLKQWSVDLPATEDYQMRTETLPATAELPANSYWLISSHDEKFGDVNNVVSFTDFWVSDLAIVMRQKNGSSGINLFMNDSGSLGGFVLDAISGEPIAGATVKAWYRQRDNKRTAIKPVTTDAAGLFLLPKSNKRNYAILASHKKQQLATANDFGTRDNNRRRAYDRSIFFTDRSLYRPGQTIHYKGIGIRVDQEKDRYDVIAGESITVIFSDGNGKEIAKQETRSNDFGSFSGSFNAPRDRLMGNMSIRVSKGPGGSASFNVEEYKRPKFQVAVAAPEVAPKLGGEVVVTGTATAYTGAAINDAQVQYRVVREVRYPSWWRTCYWWRPFPQTPSQEIEHGALTTGADGTFTIKFNAKPDLSVPEEDEPTFHFTIYADVTDTSGETRSEQRSVKVGYTALKASLVGGSWLTSKAPVAIAISTETLDGEGQAAKGTLKIYRLKAPKTVQRATITGSRGWRPGPLVRRGGKLIAPAAAPLTSDPNSWPLGEVVAEKSIATAAAGTAEAKFELGVGNFRAIFTTRDRFGKEIQAQLPLTVLDPDAKSLAIKVPQIVAAPEWKAEPGEEFMALWGTGYDKGRAYIEIIHRRKTLQSYWTKAGTTQIQIKQAVDESMRGGFTIHITYVRENRAYLTSRKVDVPWTNKNLMVQWEHFVSKLEPGNKETWTAIVTGPDAKSAVAEMVAGLYDASLDAYKPHAWQTAFNVFRQDRSNLQSRFQNTPHQLQRFHGGWPHSHFNGSLTYRSFPPEIMAVSWRQARYRSFGGGGMAKNGRAAPMAPMAMEASMADSVVTESGKMANKAKADRELPADMNSDGGGVPKPDLSKVSARKNLDETAFFFPKLVSSKDGEVRLEFTMPEALTEWKLMAFAHDKQLRSGYLQDKAITSKDIMVQPNPPRFLREGDQLEFTVKVSNQSAVAQQGTVRLTFNDARSNQSVDAALGLENLDQAFDIPAKQSKSFSWRIKVPDDQGFLTYKAVGSTGKLSDGEQGFLPVLSRRILVTESLPLPIRGKGEKTFKFDKLLASGKSDSLQSKTYTVQMVSNPSWYAVMALPYLMEYPHQCAEQTFNRLYANTLAAHIANSDPKIRRIFDQWRGTDALDSPLEKNQDLKAVMLEETPWFRQAMNESQARKNVGILFENNRLESEMASLMRKLGEMQLDDGAWPWFPGGRSNDYITLYITTGFGRLRHLDTDIDPSLAIKSLNHLDGWIDKIYRDILKHGHKENNHLSPTIALYLYGRSFFLEDKAISKPHKEAVDYFLGQGRQYWLKLGNRQSKAHLALALQRFGDKKTPRDIMASIKEFSKTDEEMGMFWRDTEMSYWWYRAPIESQAMMIEAFDEIMDDQEAVEECRIWLLKQKQTQDWKTTKATADAVYGLLLRGTDILASDALVEVAVGGEVIKPEKVEAGTGFYEERRHGGDIKPKLGDITVKKIDDGVAWGSVHWQYMEDMKNITSHEGTPLTLKKALFKKVNTDKGPTLEPLVGALDVGNELVVRLILRVDRDMEYIHLKDQRGSGTEPVNVLSRYKFQDGLAYYESTRDTASHFFIDYLPKGTYVFEYSTRVVHKGEYQTGIANIECMYAPEFNSHSESFELRVE